MSHTNLSCSAAALGRELRYAERSETEARERLRQSGVGDDGIGFVIGRHKHLPNEAYTLTPVVQEVTGHPPRSFASWAAEHAAAFGG